MLRSLRYVAIAGATAIIAGLIISFATQGANDRRYRPWMTEKLALLRERPAGTNAIFAGASVTLRSIVPAEVDAAAAAAGCADIRSINLGMPGAKVFEVAFMVDKVLETPDLPEGSFVVYDAVSDDRVRFDEVVLSDRSPIAVRFGYVGDVFASAPLSWDHVKSIFAYVRAAASEALSVHMLSDIALDQIGHAGAFDPAKAGARGYVSLEEEPNIAQRRDLYLARYKAGHEADIARWSVEPYRRDAAGLRPNQFGARIREAGHRPVIFAAPWPTGDLAAAAEMAESQDPGLDIIAIRKDNAPEIFAGTELWFDQGHMTAAGARLVSGMVGRSLCAMAKGR